MRAGAGVGAAILAWLSQPTNNGGPLGAVLLVTILACTFGMVSSFSRVRDMRKDNAALRVMLLNAGAVYTAALVLAVEAATALSSCALIGLGVGLAGATVLEVIERGAVAVAQRLAGVSTPVAREELEEKLGEVRQNAQLAASEARLKATRGEEATRGLMPPTDHEI